MAAIIWDLVHGNAGNIAGSTRLENAVGDLTIHQAFLAHGLALTSDPMTTLYLTLPLR